jgi:hypothetical protein
MDLNFPCPMLNSPAETGADAANAFYSSVVRRVDEARKARQAVLKLAHVSASNKEVPDYAEIVRQINICIAEIRPRLSAVRGD